MQRLLEVWTNTWNTSQKATIHVIHAIKAQLKDISKYSSLLPIKQPQNGKNNKKEGTIAAREASKPMFQLIYSTSLIKIKVSTKD